MARIRIDPEQLQSCSRSLNNISIQLNNLSREVNSIGNCAPSYQGEFGPAVRGIASGPSGTIHSTATLVESYAGKLASIASRFAEVDMNSSSGIAGANGAFASISDLTTISQMGALNSNTAGAYASVAAASVGVLGLGMADTFRVVRWAHEKIGVADAALTAFTPQGVGHAINFAARNQKFGGVGFATSASKTLGNAKVGAVLAVIGFVVGVQEDLEDGDSVGRALLSEGLETGLGLGAAALLTAGLAASTAPVLAIPALAIGTFFLADTLVMGGWNIAHDVAHLANAPARADEFEKRADAIDYPDKIGDAIADWMLNLPQLNTNAVPSEMLMVGRGYAIPA